MIPADVEVAETRNHGTTANDKAMKLIQKLLFATGRSVALVFIALGRREAGIVGSAVVLTLAATLFASWAWGFTLNRVSLFALIFSIGILVDDAIVVVENIHRHQQLHPGKTLRRSSPARSTGRRPDDPGHAHRDRGAAADGLRLRADGAVHEPIPINASMGMLLSLAIAFVVTPWLARMKRLANGAATAAAGRQAVAARRRCSSASSARCSTRSAASRRRRALLRRWIAG